MQPARTQLRPRVSYHGICFDSVGKGKGKPTRERRVHEKVDTGDRWPAGRVAAVSPTPSHPCCTTYTQEECARDKVLVQRGQQLQRERGRQQRRGEGHVLRTGASLVLGAQHDTRTCTHARRQAQGPSSLCVSSMQAYHLHSIACAEHIAGCRGCAPARSPCEECVCLRLRVPCPHLATAFPSTALPAPTASFRYGSDAPTFQCTQCAYVTVRPDNLRRHERFHLGDRPFTCDQCPAAFVTKFDLDNHHRRHTGERPYVCSLCPATFIKSTNLTSHRRRHHPDDPGTTPSRPRQAAGAASPAVATTTSGPKAPLAAPRGRRMMLQSQRAHASGGAGGGGSGDGGAEPVHRVGPRQRGPRIRPDHDAGERATLPLLRAVCSPCSLPLCTVHLWL